MNFKQTKDMARQWVNEEASKIPGFSGAFFTGSINWKNDDDAFPSTSDVDLIVVTDDPITLEHQKFLYHRVVLEVSYKTVDHIQSPEAVLGNYILACHFSKPNIILDPFGQLTKLQVAVSKDYAKRIWVQKRCEHVRELLMTSLQWLDQDEPLHDQVFAWLYPTSVLALIILVADLKNPTARKCFVNSKEVLSRYGQLSLHESMLSILGSIQMNQKQVEDHLTACAEVYDFAKEVIKTPFFFASDISDFARPSMIDGSRELIESGDYREAVFWIAVVQSWCQKILYNDAPSRVQDRFLPSYRSLLDDLGITSSADLQKRNEQIKGFLPQVWEVAEAIIVVNPEIVE